MPVTNLTDASNALGTLVGASTLVSRSQSYSDLDLSLTLHPDFHDIIPLQDIDAVTNAVRNLLLTNFNERPFQPDVGGNLRGLLFEPADQFTIHAVKQYITRCLIKFESRVDSVSIDITDDSDNNQYVVQLSFQVISLAQNVDMTIYLQRIR